MQEALPESGSEAKTEPPLSLANDRFRAGALSPVEERGRSGKQGEARSKGWRVFDKALLVAEVISAIVVTWLVAQYIYTAYIDTTPHRVGSNRPLPSLGQVARTPTRTPTSHPAESTPTRLSEVAPPVQGTAQTGSASASGGKSDDTGPDAFVPQPDEWIARATPSVTATPTATPTVDPKLLLPTRLRIPVMFLDSPVHEVRINMGKWEVSPMDIGHHEGSGNPGEVGNVVLAGHRDINSALFRELDRLQPGDSVFVSNSLGEYRYVVTDSFVVTPDHTEVMDPTDDKRVTLITCTPIGLATQRLIVTAQLDESYAPGKSLNDLQP
jgi:sortase A